MGTSPGTDPASNESLHRDITRLPNTNECGEAWDDVIAWWNQDSNVSKWTEEATCSQQSVVGRQALDPVDNQVVNEQEQVLTESLVFVSLFFLWRICFSLPALAAIDVYTTITLSHKFILFQQGNIRYFLFHWTLYRRWKMGVDRLIKTWNKRSTQHRQLPSHPLHGIKLHPTHHHPRHFWSTPSHHRTNEEITLHLAASISREVYHSLYTILYTQYTILILSHATNIWHMSQLSYHHIRHFLA